ncbi:MAG TPA: DUF433 domain-containing protein [Patescibacteria group bacterium]|nr:DUF433 domain-containing protein [Patescibacteria group bacterium]
MDLDRDPRELPAYGVVEAAHYLQIPLATIRSWVVGRYYPTQSGKRFFKPIIVLPDKTRPLLSFMNLVEAHILDAIRRQHEVQLQKVRVALEYLNLKFPSKHPLADQKFETDGLDLFVEKYGELINISQEGQLAVRKLIQAYLSRIERDARGIPISLYPFTRRRALDEPKAIVIDPYVSFGRPVLVGTGIATAIVAERYKAGESMDDLADDYGRRRSEIEEAIRCELQVQAA